MKTDEIVLRKKYKNHTGLFFSGDTLVYAEYCGRDVLFREQFKFYLWYGADAKESWDGHQEWDYDRALLIGGYRWEFICGEIWSNGPGFDSQSFSGKFTSEISGIDFKNEWEAFDVFFQEAEKKLNEFYCFKLATKEDVLSLAEKDEMGHLLLKKYNEIGLIEKL